MNNKTPLASHKLQRFVATFSLTLVAFGATACASPTTPAVATSIPTNTLAPTALPTPTVGLFQQPVIQQPIIAPTVAMAGGGAPIQAATQSDTPTAVPSAVPLPFGYLQTSGSFSLQPVGLGRQALFGTSKPQPGNIFLFITILVQNNSNADPVQFNPNQFVLVSDDDTIFHVVALEAVPNELKALVLNPGDRAQGIIIYEVPQAQTKGSLKFNDTTPLAWLLNS